MGHPKWACDEPHRSPERPRQPRAAKPALGLRRRVGGILQRAVEAGRIATNPQRLVRMPAPSPKQEVRPLAPTAVEAVRAQLRTRDALVVALLAYAGIRPQELRALRWGHVQERTLIVHAPKTRRHRTAPRTVRLLAPLAQDCANGAWRRDDQEPTYR